VSEEFLGYERPKGKVGIRNKIAIISSVVCVNHVTQQIANQIENAVAITHTSWRKVNNLVPLEASHILNVLSLLAEAIRLPSGLKVTEET